MNRPNTVSAEDSEKQLPVDRSEVKALHRPSGKEIPIESRGVSVWASKMGFPFTSSSWSTAQQLACNHGTLAHVPLSGFHPPSAKPRFLLPTGHHRLWSWLCLLSFPSHGIRSWILPKRVIPLASVSYHLLDSVPLPLPSFHECHSGLEAKGPTCSRKVLIFCCWWWWLVCWLQVCNHTQVRVQHFEWWPVRLF